MDGPGDNFIWAGFGDDTINATAHEPVFSAVGQRHHQRANGSNTVIPGPGKDTVALGTATTPCTCSTYASRERQKIDAGAGSTRCTRPSARGSAPPAYGRSTISNAFIVRTTIVARSAAITSAARIAPNDDDHDGTLNCPRRVPARSGQDHAGLCNAAFRGRQRNGDKIPDCVDECQLDGKRLSRTMPSARTIPRPNARVLRWHHAR